MKRPFEAILFIVVVIAMLYAGNTSQAKPASMAPPPATSTTPVAASSPDASTVNLGINPMTGEPLSTEELRAHLVDDTLKADIATQNLKAAQSLSQIKIIQNAPDPAARVVSASVAPPHHEIAQRKTKEVLAVAPISAPTPIPASPVLGVLTQNGQRYALLQLDGAGQMAAVGDTIAGHHVQKVDAGGVTLDGRFYAINTPVTEIANVDVQRGPDTGPSAVKMAPVSGGLTGGVGSTASPFDGGPLPPLPSVITQGR